MSLIPVEEAKKRFLAGIEPLAKSDVPLGSAHGRVLAQDVKAMRTQPPFDASSMDGYAVRYEDVTSVPVNLQIIGEAPAGRAYSGTVGPGETVRIFTGAPLPAGADTIVIQENTKRVDDTVEIQVAPNDGQFVRKSGLDFKEGETVLSTGTHLDARHIGLCASMNYPTLPVRKRPRVAILATGDELAAPGATLRPDQIVASNSYALAAAIENWGGVPVDLGLVPDNLEKIAEAIDSAKDADILVSTGGVSVGDHDLVGPAFESLGIELDFWRVAMRPGKPVMFARRGEQRIAGLPGNPVSALVTSLIFVKPMINAFLGFEDRMEPVFAKLSEPLGANDQRQDYLRVALSNDDDGNTIATPFPRQDSSMQRILARSDGLLVRPPFADAAKKGETVQVLPITF